MKLREITDALERWAPLSYQESYDNSGLITGNPDDDIDSAMVTLDCTEPVVDEAIERGVRLIIAHHPIVFGGLKRFTGVNYVERTVIKAIRNGIAIYALHTNLDNVDTGVNAHLCELLGLESPLVLNPKEGTLEKLVVFVPNAHVEPVRAAMFSAGAGSIGAYDECSFNLEGEGTFRGGDASQPFVGTPGTRHHEAETRVEVVLPSHLRHEVIRAMKQQHPYEEVAFDCFQLKNHQPSVGSGMLGSLPEPLEWTVFFDRIKTQLHAPVIRHTTLPDRRVQRVAVCGGSGFFLLGVARRMKADLFITSDVKYHQFFDAEGIVLADVGHWESEHRTVEIIAGYLKQKFPNFAVHFSHVNTNPVKYY